MSVTPPPVPPMSENQQPMSGPTPPYVAPAPPAEPYFDYLNESRYSIRRVVQQMFILFVISAVAAIVAYCVDTIAYAREEAGLLSAASSAKVIDSTSYCFALTLITLSTLLLLELRFRRPINNLQYTLVGAAIFCFYMLMLSFAEQIMFAVAFSLAALMTIVMIAAFVNGLMHKTKATATIVCLLLVEYGILMGLLYIGSFALLAGSLILFGLIALAMFFTLRMKIVNDELYIGNPDE